MKLSECVLFVRFAPLMNGSRPLSGKRDNLIAANELVDIHGTRPPTLEALQAMDKRNSAPPSPKFSKEQVAEQNQARRQSRARTSSRSKDPEGNDYSVKEGRPSLVAANTASAAKVGDCHPVLDVSESLGTIDVCTDGSVRKKVWFTKACGEENKERVYSYAV